MPLYGMSGKLGPPSNISPEQAAEQQQRAADDAAKLLIAGREHWDKAHRTIRWTAETFAAWIDGIPAFGCSCKRDADEYFTAHPPPLDDDDGMFVALVDFHNHVNAKLSKDILPLPTARARWGR